MTDVLELIVPSTAKITAYDALVEAESLKFLDWFRFDTILAECFDAFAGGEYAKMLNLIGKAIKLAAGLSPSTMTVDEALAAFVVLGRLNELRYMDPDFEAASEENKNVAVDGLGNRVLVELLATLCARFTMSEVEKMTPEMAILLWQRIREEIAADRDVVFYSTEMGYDRRWTDKKKGKYTLMPRQSPYAPLWQRRKMKRERALEIEAEEPHVPRYVKDAGKVVDGKTRKTLEELGEVKSDS